MINKKGYTILRLSPTQVVITVSHGYLIYYKQTIVEFTATVCYNPFVHITVQYYSVSYAINRYRVTMQHLLQYIPTKQLKLLVSNIQNFVP